MKQTSDTGDTKEKAIDKIRKLMQVTKENGSSESEINMALVTMRKIIMKHDISESEYQKDDKESYSFKHAYPVGRKSYETKDWQEAMVNQLCIFYSCYGYSDGSGKYFYICGAKSDVELVIETADFLIPLTSALGLKNYQDWSSGIRDRFQRKTGQFLTIKQCREYKLLDMTKAQYVKSYIHGFINGTVHRLMPQVDDETDEIEVEEYRLMTLDKISVIKDLVKETVPLTEVEFAKAFVNEGVVAIGFKDGSTEPHKQIG